LPKRAIDGFAERERQPSSDVARAASHECAFDLMHARHDRFGARIGSLASEEDEPPSANVHRQAEVMSRACGEYAKRGRRDESRPYATITRDASGGAHFARYGAGTTV
jgi:hypothetical protein